MSDSACPACSIVIPTWNGREWVDRCLRSVLRSGDMGNVEIIVVDDGSTDGTQEHILASFPGVVVVRHEQNGGFGAACNKGVAQSGAPVVVLLNNDIVVEPGFLAPLLVNFRDDRVFAVNARVFQMDGSTPGGGLVRGYFHGGLLRLRWAERDADRERPTLSLYANGAAAAWSRAKFLELGGFDPLYAPFYSEDLDLSYRAWQRGWEIRYEPQSRARHEHSATIKSAYEIRTVERISRRNRILFVWRNIRDRRLLAYHALWMTLRGIGALLKGDRVFLQALYDAIQRIREVCRRRAADPCPVVPDREILRKTSRWDG